MNQKTDTQHEICLMDSLQDIHQIKVCNYDYVGLVEMNSFKQFSSLWIFDKESRKLMELGEETLFFSGEAFYVSDNLSQWQAQKLEKKDNIIAYMLYAKQKPEYLDNTTDEIEYFDFVSFVPATSNNFKKNIKNAVKDVLAYSISDSDCVWGRPVLNIACY